MHGWMVVSQMVICNGLSVPRLESIFFQIPKKILYFYLHLSAIQLVCTLLGTFKNKQTKKSKHNKTCLNKIPSDLDRVILHQISDSSRVLSVATKIYI